MVNDCCLNICQKFSRVWCRLVEHRPERILIQDGWLVVFFPVSKIPPPADVHGVTQNTEEAKPVEAVPAVWLRLLGSVKPSCHMCWDRREEVNAVKLPCKLGLVEVKFNKARVQPLPNNLCVRLVYLYLPGNFGIAHKTPGKGPPVILASFSDN